MCKDRGASLVTNHRAGPLVPWPRRRGRGCYGAGRCAVIRPALNASSRASTRTQTGRSWKSRLPPLHAAQCRNAKCYKTNWRQLQNQLARYTCHFAPHSLQLFLDCEPNCEITANCKTAPCACQGAWLTVCFYWIFNGAGRGTRTPDLGFTNAEVLEFLAVP